VIVRFLFSCQSNPIVSVVRDLSATFDGILIVPAPTFG